MNHISNLIEKSLYIKVKVSVALQVLAELKRVLKEDAGLELNVVKTSVLSKGVTQQAAFR